MKYTISILIPCLNEKITIKKAIFDAKINADKLFKNKYEIVVADNGSTDGSLEIIRKIKGIKIIQVPVKGYGAALHWGIKNSAAIQQKRTRANNRHRTPESYSITC